MSLNWDMEKCDPKWKELFPDTEDGCWNERLFMLIHYCWFTEFGSVTPKNYMELYERIKVYDKVVGCLLMKVEDGKRVDAPITFEEVVAVIGMRVNVCYESKTSFKNKMFKILYEDVQQLIRQEFPAKVSV